MNTKNVFPLNLLILAFAGQSAFGALVYNDLETEETFLGSGVYQFVNPGTTGWAGTGTVDGPAGYGTGGNNTMIDDFTGTGVLSLGLAYGYGPPIIDPTTTGTMTVTLGGGGSGDVVVNLHSSGRVVGFNITDLKGGVTSVAMEINWSEPVAPAYSGGAVPRTNAPFLGAFRAQTGGGANGWNVTGEYLGLRHTTTLGGPFIAGLPAGLTAADSIDMSENGAGFQWGSGTTYSGTSTSNRWKGIHLFDIDGDSIIEDVIDGDSILQDGEAIYGTGIRYTFTKPGGAILDGNNFLMSTNGSQVPDTFADSLNVVPEPAGAILMSLGLCSALCRRRRNE